MFSPVYCLVTSRSNHDGRIIAVESCHKNPGVYTTLKSAVNCLSTDDCDFDCDFSLVFFYISWLCLCVGYWIDNVYISLAFYFWHVCFGIRYFAFVFWRLLSAYIVCLKKHFVSISMVTFWHLYSTHAYTELDAVPKLYLLFLFVTHSFLPTDVC